MNWDNHEITEEDLGYYLDNRLQDKNYVADMISDKEDDILEFLQDQEEATHDNLK